MNNTSLKCINDIITLLPNIFPNSLYAHDFTLEHYFELLKTLSVHQNKMIFEERKGMIKHALIQYFSDSGQHIDLEITFDTFTLQKKYIVPAKDQKFDRWLHQKKAILYSIYLTRSEYKKVEYLLSIPSDIRNRLFEDFVTPEEARHYIRLLLNEIFELNPKDIILFLNQKIYIRYFMTANKISSSKDKRYAGESVEEMQSLYTKYFPLGVWDAIESVLDDVLEDKLNFSKIDNPTFAKLFIPVFRSMVDVILEDILEESDRQRLEGLTGYILRQYFDEILMYTAKNLLVYVSSFDKNAEMFIKYYSDEIMIDAFGVKIQKPLIIDSRQQKWNFSSIVSIMIQYKQSTLKIAKQKEAIKGQNSRCLNCEEKMKSIIDHKNSLIAQKEEISINIHDTEKSIGEFHRKINKISKLLPQNETKLSELFQRKKMLFESENEIIHEIESTKNKLINKYHELNRLKKRYEHEKATLETFQKQSEPIFENYNHIVHAIAKVLAKR